MKKLFLIINSIAFAFLASCSNDFSDNVFGEDSSTRLTKSVEEYHTLLQSAPEGWAFEYWPGGTTQAYGGYTYALKFTEDEVVAMLDIVSASAGATSTYDVVRNGGATLSFDTYNPLLHFFAKPSAQRYTAFEGDYEFLLMSHTDDEIIVHGKKFNSVMRLYKTTEPITTFMEKVVDISSYVTERGFYSFEVNGTDVEFATNERTIIYNHVSNGTTEVRVIPYLFTQTGLKTYKPITIDGVTFQELTLDKATNTLKNSDGSVVLTLAQLLPISFDNEARRYEVYNTGNSTAFNAKFDEVIVASSGLDIGFGVPFDLFPRIVLGTATNGKGAYFWCHFSTDVNVGLNVFQSLNFMGTTIPNEVAISQGTTNNFMAYFKTQPMIDYLVENSPYIISDETTNTPKLTSKNNPDVWFILN